MVLRRRCVVDLRRQEFHRHLAVLGQVLEHRDAVLLLLRRLVGDKVDHALEVVDVLLPARPVPAHAGDGERNAARSTAS